MASAAMVACGGDDDDPTPDAGTPTDMGPMPTCTRNDVLTEADIDCSTTPCTVPAGEYVGAVSFSAANQYLLAGQVFLGDGTEDCSGDLTIEAGTQVFANSATQGYLAIKPNSTIDAQGTAANPIVFSSDAVNPARGDWGGIIISGNAPVNCGGTGVTCNGEGDTGAYGGTDPDDNSGTIRYVRVEYGGNQVNPTDELNGIAFQGVGSGTTVEHIHVHLSQDDGVEFFGGTVNAKYVITSGIGDDNIDWTFGWVGKLQYAVIQQHPDESDNGIEADNNGDDNAATPRSSPIISNITLVGSVNSDSSDIGMLLREGTGGQIWNAIVIDFNDAGLDIDNDETFTVAQNDGLAVRNAIFFNNGTTIKDDGAEDLFNVEEVVLTNPMFLFANNEVVDPMLTDPANIDAPNFEPMAGSPALTGGEQPNDPFFDQVTFRGGVNAGDPWYSWTEF